MDILKYIKEDTLLIIPNNIKLNILDSFNNDSKLLNVKIMSLEEIKKHIYFDYDVEAKLYIMDNYNIKEDIASVILELLYVISDKDYFDERLILLKEIKNKLIENKLLIYDKMFLNYLRSKNVLVFGYSSINKFYLNMLKDINAKIIEDEISLVKRDVYLLNTLEDEVEFVFNKISQLIKEGIDINQIKLVNVDDKYFYTIKRFSKLFSIPVYINDSSIYSSFITKKYLNVLKDEKSFSKSLDVIQEEFDLSKERNNSIYNKLLEVSNKYNDLNYSFDNIYRLVVHDIKNINLTDKKLKNQIEICSLENNSFDNCYVFLLGFNQGSIPVFYKDEDYLSDRIKVDNNLMIETTEEKNILSKSSVINSLNKIKNLFITCKEKSIDSEFMVSNLKDELDYNLIVGKINYKKSFSDNNLGIKLTKYLDEFIKYGTINDDMSLLYSNLNIDYLTYSNKFTGIDNEKLLKKLLPKLTLSYTHLDNYYHCAFKYYISHVLKLDKYEESFSAVIGNLFHYILSICFNNDFNYDIEFDKYVNGLVLTSKEKFFINKLKQELLLVIEQTKKLHFETGLTKLLLEHKITIDKSSVIPVYMMGIVDKIMYKESESTFLSIVDYKTGYADINLYNVIYGLGMQLPVYLYLVKKSNLFNNVKFTGFYLQKILSSEVGFSVSKSYKEQKLNNLKLEGYSTNDESRLEVFIPDYNDSKFVKSMKTTSKGFSTYAKIISDTEIDNLIDVVDKNINDARDNILRGDFSINPKQIGVERVGCNYCKYKDICYRTNNDFVKLKESKSLSFLGGE